jgi:hypothetical protein
VLGLCPVDLVGTAPLPLSEAEPVCPFAYQALPLRKHDGSLTSASPHESGDLSCGTMVLADTLRMQRRLYAASLLVRLANVIAPPRDPWWPGTPTARALKRIASKITR